MFKLDYYINEIKTLLAISLPLMLVQLFNSGKGIVDTMMVGHIDKFSLAGLSLANGVYMVVILFSAGFGSAAIAVLSRLYAVDDYKKMQFYTQQLLYLNTILALITTVVLVNGDYIFSHLHALDSQTKEIAADYLKILGFVYPISSLLFVLRPVMQTFVKNKELLYISGVMFFLNIPLNYIFINGFGFIPQMNALGSAYATAGCFVAEIVALVWYIKRHEMMNFFKDFAKYDSYEVKKLFSLGWPIGLAIVMEVSLFTAVTFMIAKFGEEVVGANHIGSNFLGFIFMFSLGLSFALTQRISFFIGLNQIEKVKLTVISSVMLSVIVSLFTICLTYIFRDQIVGLYTKNMMISAIAIKILMISLMYQLFDSLQVTATGILRGYKLNKTSFKYSAISYWGVGFTVGYALSNYIGVYGYWYGFTICFIVASILSFRKIYKVVWKSELKEVAK